MDNSDLAKRMKEYEVVSKSVLMKRTPVILRLDGKAFHTFTRGFQKPFDEVLIRTMQDTMKYLCENIHGCVLGYTQSDEITLALIDYKKFGTQPWFGYEVQKMCSVAASMATMEFNKWFRKNAKEYLDRLQSLASNEAAVQKYPKIASVYGKAVDKGAMFDCRAFNLSKEEVTNNFYWRQLDASRNSVQMLGQAFFSHKELQNKSCNDIQDMLVRQKGVNWNDLPTYKKRGSCYVRQEEFVPDPDGSEYRDIDGTGECIAGFIKKTWVLDKEIPVFKGEEREYIDKLIFIESDE